MTFVPGVTKEAIAMKCFHYYLLWNYLYFLSFLFHPLEKVPYSVCTIHKHEVRWSLLRTNLCHCTFLCCIIAKHEAVIIYSSASLYNTVITMLPLCAWPEANMSKQFIYSKSITSYDVLLIMFVGIKTSHKLLFSMMQISLNKF